MNLEISASTELRFREITRADFEFQHACSEIRKYRKSLLTWVAGALDGWVAGCLGGWVAGWLGGWVAGCLGAWVAGFSCVNPRMGQLGKQGMVRKYAAHL